ncbi:MAG: hypothetical protein ACO3FI_09650 [Cyclobacteriaceae bacterium]
MKEIIFAGDREKELLLRLESIQFFSLTNGFSLKAPGESKSQMNIDAKDSERFKQSGSNKNIQGR